MKVDFLIIGAQKCGTTTLFDILKRHPALDASRTKEPHFFSKATDWRRELDRYHGLFAGREGALHFEASTTYTFFPQMKRTIVDDIYAYNPKMKFIYIVRDPMERVVSGYIHSYERGHTEMSLEQAVSQDQGLLDVSRYYTQISPFIRKFGRERVLILDFDDLTSDVDALLDQIAGFLGIDAAAFPERRIRSNAAVDFPRYHHRLDSPSLALRFLRRLFPPLWRLYARSSTRRLGKRPKLTPAARQMIRRELEPEMKEVGKLMGKDLSKWLQLSERVDSDRAAPPC